MRQHDNTDNAFVYDSERAASQEPAPVGCVTPDAISEVAAGRIGNHLFPKGTLRPENEIPVYAAPVPPVVVAAGPRSLNECSDTPDNTASSVPVGEDAAHAIKTNGSIPRVNGRDIYEVANQLEGYVDEGTPERLAQFLLREGRAAADLADEIVRLSAALASSVAKPSEVKATEETLLMMVGTYNRITGYAFPQASHAEQLRAMRAVLSCLSHPAQGWREPEGWKPLTCKDDKMTCPLPADETVVEVMLNDGTICRAWYSCNIMEAGDWDFVPVKDDGEPDDEADSIADKIAAWRALPSAPAGGSNE